MKFNIEITKILHGYNADGSKVALSEGDEVYLKLDLPHMNLWDKDEWIQKYPDGWVKCRIHNISNTGKIISVKMFNHLCTHLMLHQKDILDVSDKALNFKEELK